MLAVFTNATVLTAWAVQNIGCGECGGRDGLIINNSVLDKVEHDRENDQGRGLCNLVPMVSEVCVMCRSRRPRLITQTSATETAISSGQCASLARVRLF